MRHRNRGGCIQGTAMNTTVPACATALHDLLHSVRPHPLFAARGVLCSWKDGGIHIRHMEQAQPRHARGQVADAPKPSAHMAMAKAADLEPLRPLFARWVDTMQADPAYAHAAHHLEVAMAYDGRCDFALDGWRHGPDTAIEAAALVERIREGASTPCDGTVQGCFAGETFEGMARLHPATITALGHGPEGESQRRVEAHPWLSSIAPLKKPQDSYAYLDLEDSRRIRALTQRVAEAVQTWKGREMQPIMDIGVRDLGDGPKIWIQHVMDNSRIRMHCTIADWSRTQKPPPDNWEQEVLGCWNDLWRELCKDAPVLEHTSPTHPREGRFTPAHTASGFGTITLWGQQVGTGEKLLLARGMEIGPLHMAVSGDNGTGLPIHSADTKRFARFVRALAPEGRFRYVHVFGPRPA
jgi:hypothetical protein